VTTLADKWQPNVLSNITHIAVQHYFVLCLIHTSNAKNIEFRRVGGVQWALESGFAHGSSRKGIPPTDVSAEL